MSKGSDVGYQNPSTESTSSKYTECGALTALVELTPAILLHSYSASRNHRVGIGDSIGLFLDTPLAGTRTTAGAEKHDSFMNNAARIDGITSGRLKARCQVSIPVFPECACGCLLLHGLSVLQGPGMLASYCACFGA